MYMYVSGSICIYSFHSRLYILSLCLVITDKHRNHKSYRSINTYQYKKSLDNKFDESLLDTIDMTKILFESAIVINDE